MRTVQAAKYTPRLGGSGEVGGAVSRMRGEAEGGKGAVLSAPLWLLSDRMRRAWLSALFVLLLFLVVYGFAFKLNVPQVLLSFSWELRVPFELEVEGGVLFLNLRITHHFFKECFEELLSSHNGSYHIVQVLTDGIAGIKAELVSVVQVFPPFKLIPKKITLIPHNMRQLLPGRRDRPHLSTPSFQAVVESDEVSPQPPFLQAKQSQLPQPLPISLVLQTLPQLRCPSLDTLQPLNVFLVVRGPKLDTVFKC
ncbi:hypothetical protein QYF61_003321 [Mycteria americana]|uniref:NUP210 fourth Ig-like domain-containing protein n=1 Tax=Mycteria americana TaxID=33587 RepID=A0AAN7N2H4_MYCAM|nr:hypothetical protein QYF61_003321 [Mycteria americana]